MCIQAFWTEISADRLNTVLDDLLEELKITKRQRMPTSARGSMRASTPTKQNSSKALKAARTRFSVSMLSVTAIRRRTRVVGSSYLHHILVFTQNPG